MEKKHDEFLEESERESTKNCHAWLDPRSKELVENLLEGQYDESDGKLKFDLNLQAIEDEYNNLPGLGYNVSKKEKAIWNGSIGILQALKSQEHVNI